MIVPWSCRSYPRFNSFEGYMLKAKKEKNWSSFFRINVHFVCVFTDFYAWIRCIFTYSCLASKKDTSSLKNNNSISVSHDWDIDQSVMVHDADMRLHPISLLWSPNHVTDHMSDHLSDYQRPNQERLRCHIACWNSIMDWYPWPARLLGARN